MSVERKECGDCMYFKQGNNCSFCANPKQIDESKKQYSYYNFTCGLYKEGIHRSRIDFMKTFGDEETKKITISLEKIKSIYPV